MIRLIRFETYKLIRQPRVWLTFAVMMVLMFLINLGMGIDGQKMIDLLIKPLSEQFIISGNLINGHLIAYVALNMLWVHIPVLLVIVTGDLVSGEFDAGTIRLMLCSTWTRAQWLTAKVVAALIYIFFFMLFSGVLMIIPAHLIFGSGDLLVFNAGIQIIEDKQVLWRFVLALLFGTLGMMTFACISILFSVLLRNSLAAILVSLGILIVSTLLQTFGMGIFDSWRNLLFTWHMAQWQNLFFNDVEFIPIIKSAGVLLAHQALVLSIAFILFKRMKITE
ncbi:MAG: ABC transporter permease subunit [Bacteroides sp.]|nr:ABC transporter permease subunit [Bacteroides sp.]